MKYTRKDVIVDPDDVRLEIGAEYFTADSIRTALELANSGKYGFLVELVDIVDEDSPFLVISNEDNCYVDFLIRRKEPEKRYVPFDLSNEKVRKSLRGKWIKNKNNNFELCISCFTYEGHVGNTIPADVYMVSGIDADELLNSWVFEDNTPCGKLLEIEE